MLDCLTPVRGGVITPLVVKVLPHVVVPGADLSLNSAVVVKYTLVGPGLSHNGKFLVPPQDTHVGGMRLGSRVASALLPVGNLGSQDVVCVEDLLLFFAGDTGLADDAVRVGLQGHAVEGVECRVVTTGLVGKWFL